MLKTFGSIRNQIIENKGGEANFKAHLESLKSGGSGKSAKKDEKKKEEKKKEEKKKETAKPKSKVAKPQKMF